MDIDLLSKMVKELILDNERVVLPGLGCFVAEVVPATFSDRGYTINPPYRKLYFRSHPDEGKLLTEMYARSNDVSVEMADRILRKFLKELQSVLFTRKTVVFPGLGRLRATKENNMFFVADEDLDIYPVGFALETISMKSHQEREERAVSALGQFKDMMAGMHEPEAVPAADEEVKTNYDAPVAEPEAEIEPVVDEEDGAVEDTAIDIDVDNISVLPVEEETGTEPVEETGTESGEEAAVETVVEPGQEPATDAKPKKRSSAKTIWIIVAIIAVAALLVIGGFFLLDWLAPELMDSLLYSEEELQILHYGE